MKKMTQQFSQSYWFFKELHNCLDIRDANTRIFYDALCVFISQVDALPSFEPVITSYRKPTIIEQMPAKLFEVSP